jgi:hypothetical protein
VAPHTKVTAPEAPHFNIAGFKVKMSRTTIHPFLPPELILYVVDFIVPPWVDTEVAYPPSHPITSTLLALTRTSRIIYSAARHLLYTHCLYIDSIRRLLSLLNSLSAYTTGSSLYLDPFYGAQQGTSLYLSPFTDNINNLPLAQAVHDLLSLLAPTLRRLVIDIPLRSLYPEDDTLKIRPILRSAFTQLVSLELFCSVRDECFLFCTGWPAYADEANAWSFWPKLKTLALYNCDLHSERFWQDLTVAKNLETLVLTRCDGVQDVNFKSEWIKYGNGERSVKVVFVDVDDERGLPEMVENESEGEKVGVMRARIPTSYYGDEDIIELCQGWIKRSVLRGERGLQAELKRLSE